MNRKGKRIILDGCGWAKLLAEQPQFADKCDWRKLDDGDWVDLLAEQPQFADKCDLSIIDADVETNNLMILRELAQRLRESSILDSK